MGKDNYIKQWRNWQINNFNIRSDPILIIRINQQEFNQENCFRLQIIRGGKKRHYSGKCQTKFLKLAQKDTAPRFINYSTKKDETAKFNESVSLWLSS